MALENIQDLALQKNYEFQIKTSLKEDYELIINPSTKFFRTENMRAEAEFYFYGILRDAGGKNKANIHLDTQDYGYLSIETGESFLKEREENNANVPAMPVGQGIGTDLSGKPVAKAFVFCS